MRNLRNCLVCSLKGKATEKKCGLLELMNFSLYINYYLYVCFLTIVFPFFFIKKKIAGQRTVLNPEVPFVSLIGSTEAS